ncbi:hypothetical protein JRQ81_007993 [Phrynocephalus forsythii]|uniref:Uncharacterized protein n=1 Tax=Phrynocephalus forsythii TaxID=171643 RepID=A0A9Q0Y3V9_9SAUR|nr:hypothetical protein JRQ81_007993 [Phrynocephalus forsythii]
MLSSSCTCSSVLQNKTFEEVPLCLECSASLASGSDWPTLLLVYENNYSQTLPPNGTNTKKKKEEEEEEKKKEEEEKKKKKKKKKKKCWLF